MKFNNVFTSWLSNSKITPDVMVEFNIHVGNHDKLGECIVIPINNSDGSFSFNKYRRNPMVDDVNLPKYLYDAGASMTLFGGDKIKNHNKVLLVEGEKDALVCWSHNIPAVSSTGGAMSFNREWTELLDGKEVTILFDNDEPGGTGMARLMEWFPDAKVVFLPDRPGIKDIADYVGSGGDIHKLLDGAVLLNSMEAVTEHRANRLALWQSTHYHDAYIKRYSPKPESKYVKNRSDKTDKIERAREYPIDTIAQFNGNKRLCYWHNEKSPSLTYFPGTNSCWCFGCSKRADAIDIYRAEHNCTFLEAINALS